VYQSPLTEFLDKKIDTILFRKYNLYNGVWFSGRDFVRIQKE